MKTYLPESYVPLEAVQMSPIEAIPYDRPDVLKPGCESYYTEDGIAGYSYVRAAAFAHIHQDIDADNAFTVFMDEYHEKAERRKYGYDIIPSTAANTATPMYRLAKAAIAHYWFDRVAIVEPSVMARSGQVEHGVAKLQEINVPYPPGKFGLIIVENAPHEGTPASERPLYAQLAQMVLPVCFVELSNDR
jgi:hypothetical protein